MSEPDAMVTPLSLGSRCCRAARWRSGRANDPGTILDGQDQPAVSAGLHLGAAAQAAHRAADPERLAVHLALGGARRTDEGVVQAIRQAGREDRLARLVQLGRAAVLVVVDAGPR